MSQELSFCKRLKKERPNKYHQTTDENFELWKQFVLDHRASIINTSVIEHFSEEEMYHTRYRLKNYLNSKGYDQSIFWIILNINNLKTEIDFKELSYIKIPRLSYLDSLKRDFMAYISKYNKS